MTDVRFTNWRR